MWAAHMPCLEAMRLLLDRPSSELAFDNAGDCSVLVAAAEYTRHCGYGIGDDGLPKRPCAPLLLQLRRVTVDASQPSDAQLAAHMTIVMVELWRAGMFDDDQPDDARDECVCLLMELGARCGVCDSTPVMARIIREVFAMKRVPQLINEAVVGLAAVRQQ
ncbi:hypothetical protein FOA52_002928 [Chlamydomonas sp. UWO 241]|nr:hypothetical protein FOA52_002928 [Chlamydomonas sp. UWO 241]